MAVLVISGFIRLGFKIILSSLLGQDFIRVRKDTKNRLAN